MPEPHAVDQVRDTPADHEAQRHRQDGVARAGAREEVQHPRDGQSGEQDHDRRRAREQAERDARVRHVVNRERPHDVHRVVQVEAARHDRLRQLVCSQCGQRHRDQAHPLRERRAEGTNRGGDRRQTVGRRPDADVCRPRRRLFSQRRSRSRWQSMHVVAQGRASSRSVGIGLPQFVQIP